MKNIQSQFLNIQVTLQMRKQKKKIRQYVVELWPIGWYYHWSLFTPYGGKIALLWVFFPTNVVTVKNLLLRNQFQVTMCRIWHIWSICWVLLRWCKTERVVLIMSICIGCGMSTNILICYKKNVRYFIAWVVAAFGKRGMTCNIQYNFKACIIMSLI